MRWVSRLPKQRHDLGKPFGTAIFAAQFGPLNVVLDDAVKFSQHTGAWLSLWLGYAFEFEGDGASGSYFYRKAHALETNIPRTRPSTESTSARIPLQVVQLAEQMRIGYSNTISIEMPKTMRSDLAPLDGTGTVGQTEEALRCLGQFLGLDATRPDNDPGTGPDVLWVGEGGLAVCMEVKTCKTETSFYRKNDVGQLHNHVQWVKRPLPNHANNPRVCGAHCSCFGRC